MVLLLVLFLGTRLVPSVSKRDFFCRKPSRPLSTELLLLMIFYILLFIFIHPQVNTTLSLSLILPFVGFVQKWVQSCLVQGWGRLLEGSAGRVGLFVYVLVQSLLVCEVGVLANLLTPLATENLDVQDPSPKFELVPPLFAQVPQPQPHLEILLAILNFNKRLILNFDKNFFLLLPPAFWPLPRPCNRYLSLPFLDQSPLKMTQIFTFRWCFAEMLLDVGLGGSVGGFVVGFFFVIWMHIWMNYTRRSYMALEYFL